MRESSFYSVCATITVCTVYKKKNEEMNAHACLYIRVRASVLRISYATRTVLQNARGVSVQFCVLSDSFFKIHFSSRRTRHTLWHTNPMQFSFSFLLNWPQISFNLFSRKKGSFIFSRIDARLFLIFLYLFRFPRSTPIKMYRRQKIHSQR